MHGSTSHPLFVHAITAIALIAALTDLVCGKIFNWLTLSALVAGLIASFAFFGWKGLGSAFAGVLIALFAYGALFWAGAMAGGDVKFLMALAAWGGLSYAVQVGILSILVGGAMALVVLLVTGRIVGFYRRMSWFLITLMVKEFPVEKPKIDWELKMPFGVPIAVAAVWVAYARPLEKWGLLPWSG
jgi:prepilin peptidase CpaA